MIKIKKFNKYELKLLNNRFLEISQDVICWWGVLLKYSIQEFFRGEGECLGLS